MAFIDPPIQFIGFRVTPDTDRIIQQGPTSPGGINIATVRPEDLSLSVSSVEVSMDPWSDDLIAAVVSKEAHPEVLATATDPEVPMATTPAVGRKDSHPANGNDASYNMKNSTKATKNRRARVRRKPPARQRSE